MLSQSSVLDFTLTEHEGAILTSFITPGAEVSEVIRPDLDEAWEQLSVCLRTVKYAKEVTARLVPVIGRFLRMAKDQPEFYLRRGYPNYERFLREYVGEQLHMSRSVLYDCRLVAENLPDLTPDQYYELGVTKTKDLARVTSTSNSNFQKLLEVAKLTTVNGFKAYLEEQRLIEAGETEPVVITISTNKMVKEIWDSFINDPEVHAKCGSSAHGRIFECLLQECAFWVAPE